MLLGCSILGAIMKGGGGVEVTELTANVTANATILPVAKTTDFLGSDYVIIGNERIFYSSKNTTAFFSCTRGYGNTTAVAHTIKSLVYTADASGINNALGFSITAMQDSYGWFSVVTIPFNFFIVTIPRIIRMNLSFLGGSLSIISWIWFAMAAGFIITLAIMLIGGVRSR
jgi:hypothetical protein